MWSSDRRAYAALALIAFASLAAIASVDAQAENSRERHEHRASEGERQVARRETAAQSHRTYAPRAAGVHPAARREASYARGQPVVNDHREMVSRSINERRLTDGSVIRETHLAGGERVRGVSRGFAGGQA